MDDSPYRVPEGEIVDPYEIDKEKVRLEWLDGVCNEIRGGDLPVTTLTGLDDPNAGTLREEMKDSDSADVALSLKGIDVPEAWALRNYLLEKSKASSSYFGKGVYESIAGTNSGGSWSLREALVNKSDNLLIDTLAGIESTPRAWEMRRELFGEYCGINEDYYNDKKILDGFEGDTSHPAQDLRAHMYTLGKKNNRDITEDELRQILELSAAVGHDSPAAWKIRQKEIKEGNIDAAIKSLKSIDSPQAHELRQKYINDHPEAVAESLRGIVSSKVAWEMKKYLHMKFVSKGQHTELWPILLEQ